MRFSANAATILCAALCGCTNTDVYSAFGNEPLSPDRLALEGELCTEDASGSKFPLKILFVVDRSLDIFAADPDGHRFSGSPGSIEGIISRNLFQPHVRFGFVGVAGTSVALPAPDGQHFYAPQAPEVTAAITQLQMPAGSDRDIVAALSQVGSFVANDIAEASAGEVLRSRYLVSMLFAGPQLAGENVIELEAKDLTDQVERIKEQVYAAGALEIRFNVGLLHFGPRTIDQGDPADGPNFECYDSEPSDPNCACNNSAPQCAGQAQGEAAYCMVYCACQQGRATKDHMDKARRAFETIAFAGGGLFREFACPPNTDFAVDAATAISLVKKDIVAFNRNVHLTATGPAVDSDGDGLTDDEETAVVPATNPLTWDSDGDGLGDRIEYRTFPRQNPLDGGDRPNSCLGSMVHGIIADRDIDLLNDCEEGLLQTNPTIPDSDGDGLPDLLEFLSGTIPISAADRLLDFDSDGVKNAEEVLAHTDPRSHEGVQRGVEGYHNYIGELGSRSVASMENPPELRGISFRRASPDVLGGQSYLRWAPCDGTLAWSDARYPIGSPPYNPVPAAIPSSGTYTLFAEAANGDQISADFLVTKELLPTCQEAAEVVVFPLITVSERSCYDLRISNIKLMETQAANGESSAGINRVLLFFTQAPQSRLTSPGITKVAEIIVHFHCADPALPETCEREPAAGYLEVTEDMMVTALP